MSQLSYVTGRHGDYQYAPFKHPAKQFRLLQILQPEQAESPRPLEGRLSTFFLNSPPDYSTLSYTWGPPYDIDHPDPHSISAARAGHRMWLGTGYLDIFENLYSGLRELRNRYRDHDFVDRHGPYLWIDAICIDQTNVDERNHQVNLMDQIYSNCFKVMVWLGLDIQGVAPTVLELMLKLKSVDAYIQELARAYGGSALSLLSQNQAQYLSMFGLPEITDPKWRILSAFLTRRWFKRLWVVQEVAMAHEIEVLCGRSIIEWPLIGLVGDILGADSNRVMMDTPEGTSEAFTTLRSSMYARRINIVRTWCVSGLLPPTAHMVYYELTGTDVYDPKLAPALILATTCMFQTTDPKDKFYGLLGIMKSLTSSPEAFMSANYNLPKIDVYIEGTWRLLENTNWLGLLSLMQNTADYNPKFPSWVPDYEQDFNLGLSRTLFKKRESYDLVFNAAGKFVSTATKPAPDLARVGSCLKIVGQRIGVINAKSETLIDIHTSKNGFEAIAKMVLGLPQTYLLTGESQIDALWRTMVQDKQYGHTPQEMRQSFLAYLLANTVAHALRAQKSGTNFEDYLNTIPSILSFTSSYASKDDFIATLKAGLESPEVREENVTLGGLYAKLVQRWAEFRGVFSTDEGHLGVGHHTAEVGDEIWICPRAWVPFVLRKVQGSENGGYRFLGESYVHGTMYGELFKDKKPEWTEILLE